MEKNNSIAFSGIFCFQSNGTTLYLGDTEVTPQGRRVEHPHPDVRMVDGVRNFLHRDHLASVIQITDMTGAVVTRRDFRPYGDGEGLEWVDPLTQPESKGFIGERFDPETGLQYLHARYYDPKLGLFTQGDWWDPTDARVGTNRYMYSLGDPVNLSDPNGHAPNQNDAGDPADVADRIESAEQNKNEEDTSMDVLGNLAEMIDTGRYFETTEYGWVDSRHFLQLLLFRQCRLQMKRLQMHWDML